MGDWIAVGILAFILAWLLFFRPPPNKPLVVC